MKFKTFKQSDLKWKPKTKLDWSQLSHADLLNQAFEKDDLVKSSYHLDVMKKQNEEKRILTKVEKRKIYQKNYLIFK